MLNSRISFAICIAMPLLACSGCGDATVNIDVEASPEVSQTDKSARTVHFVTESGIELDWPFYKLEGTETLIEKLVLAAEESKEYSIDSTKPLQIGFRVPISVGVEDQLSFKKVDPEDKFAKEIAGRIVEIDPSKKFHTHAGSKTGAALFLLPIDGKIQFRLESRMAEPMEFLVYTDVLNDKQKEMMKPVNVPIGGK